MKKKSMCIITVFKMFSVVIDLAVQLRMPQRIFKDLCGATFDMKCFISKSECKYYSLVFPLKA